MGRVKADAATSVKRKRHRSYGKRKDPAPDGMNELERKYARHLDGRKARGEIKDYIPHGIYLVVVDAKPKTAEAEAIRESVYRTDFLVIELDGSPHPWSLHETKGFLDQSGDAWLKFKAAASRYPFPCYMVQEARGDAKAEGDWVIRRYGQ